MAELEVAQGGGVGTRRFGCTDAAEIRIES
jgi:hypothetical protein